MMGCPTPKDLKVTSLLLHVLVQLAALSVAQENQLLQASQLVDAGANVLSGVFRITNDTSSALPARIYNGTMQLTSNSTSELATWDMEWSRLHVFQLDGDATMVLQNLLLNNTVLSELLWPSAVANTGGRGSLQLTNVTVITTCKAAQDLLHRLCSASADFDIKAWDTGVIEVVRWTSNGLTAQHVYVGCQLDLDLARGAAVYCSGQRVANSQELETALTILQPISDNVTISLLGTMNFTVESWPGTVNISKTVMIRSANEFSSPLLDFQGRAKLLRIQPGALLQLSSLAMLNLPNGPDQAFPWSCYNGYLYAVDYNRSIETPISLDVINCTMILADDYYDYISTWVSFYTSPLAGQRQKAAWLSTNAQLNSTVVDFKVLPMDDPTRYTVVSRLSGGMNWVNVNVSHIVPGMNLTLLPSLQSCGIKQVVSDAYAPSSWTIRATTLQQLQTSLNQSDFSIVVQPVHLGLSDLEQPAMGTETLVPSTANQTASSSPPLELPMLVSPLVQNWVGLPFKPIVMDLANKGGAVYLQGGTLVLRNLVLVNAGTQSAQQVVSGQPSPLQDFTSMLWAFDNVKTDLTLRLENVALVVPQAEFKVLSAALSKGSCNCSLPATARPQFLLLSETSQDACLVCTSDTNKPSQQQEVKVQQCTRSLDATNKNTYERCAASQRGPLYQLHACLNVSMMSDTTINAMVWRGWRWSGTNITITTTMPASNYSVLPVDMRLVLGVPPPSPPGSSSAGVKPYVIIVPAVVGGAVLLVLVIGLLVLLARRCRRDDSPHMPTDATCITVVTGSLDSALSKGVTGDLGRNGSPKELPPSPAAHLANQGLHGSCTTGRSSGALDLKRASSHTTTTLSTAETEFAQGQVVGLLTPAQASPSCATSTAATTTTGEGKATGSDGSVNGISSQGTAPPTHRPTQAFALASNSSEPASGEFCIRGTVQEARGTWALELQNQRPSMDVQDLSSFGMSDSFEHVGSEYGDLLPWSQQEVDNMMANIRQEMKSREYNLTIYTPLGAGAHGVVYKGEWHGRPVAVKTLLLQEHRESTKRQALQEAAINTRLTHPNIVNTYTYELKPMNADSQAGEGPSGMAISENNGTSDWKLYIVQEYCDGGHLRRLVDSHQLTHNQDPGRPDITKVLQIALDVACGVQHIHSKSIIHGDLTPSNILLKRDESRSPLQLVAKVGDFGLSRCLNKAQSHVSNARQGTPYYVAPEVMSQGRMTKAADVYSLGVILHELYCGTPVWRRKARNALRPPQPQSGTVAAPSRLGGDDGGARAQLITLQRFLLEPQGSCPLIFPPTCPTWYAELAWQCMSGDPLARPKLFDVVARLLQMGQELGLQAVTVRPTFEASPGEVAFPLLPV